MAEQHYGRKAKRRQKALTIAAQHALNGDKELADYYQDIAERLEKSLRDGKVCIRCGRPLSTEASLASGYGPECTDANARDEEEENEPSILR